MTNLPLENKVALITGASRGIGAAVAKQYAAAGAHVILVARTISGLEAVDDAIKKDGHGDSTLVPMDLLQHDLIDQLAATIAQRFGRLDILVGNAATLGDLRPLPHFPADVWNKIMTLNVTVNWRLIQAFDSLLRASDAGRAIFVTAPQTGHANNDDITPFWGPYAASKAALEVLVKTYAAEMSQTNIRVNMIDPVAVSTALRKSAFPGEESNKQRPPESITKLFLDLANTQLKDNGIIHKA